MAIDPMAIPTGDLMFLLHDVARLLRVEADKRARRNGMTRAQWVMLIWLERRPGLSQKELSELLEVEPITVARLVDRLEARGMVERRADPDDRRIWRLHLRPAALPVLAEIEQHRDEMVALVSAGLAPDAIAGMTEGLARMKQTLCAELRARAREVQEVA
ncbi:MAG: MarR family winged helix-turn-helix transcriptional regulator [Acetobacteraceae bacterium]